LVIDQIPLAVILCNRFQYMPSVIRLVYTAIQFSAR
jgi:hypothetical protein